MGDTHKVTGRKPVLSPQQAELVKSLYHQQGSTAVELAKLFNVSRATILGFNRWLQHCCFELIVVVH
ncbi:Hin recombinase [Corynebacterium diphtheriae]|nr:Hin recombinase [Corynebacterium diphtheriae]